MAKAKEDKSRQQGRWNSEFRRGLGGQLLQLIQILAGIEAKRPYITALDFQTSLRPWTRQQSLEHRAMTRSLLLTHIMQSFKAAHQISYAAIEEIHLWSFKTLAIKSLFLWWTKCYCHMSKNPVLQILRGFKMSE